MFRCTLFFHWTPNRTADALFHHWHISNVHVKIPEQFNATTEDFYNSNVDGNACRAMMAFQSWWHTVLAPNYVSSRTWHLRDRYQATYQYGSGIYWILTVIVFSWNDVHLRKKTMRRNSGFNDFSPCLGFNYTVFYETGTKIVNSLCPFIREKQPVTNSKKSIKLSICSSTSANILCASWTASIVLVFWSYAAASRLA